MPDIKSFEITVLYGPIFTSNGFRLYNIETCFSTNPIALTYCSAVTPHSSKTSDSVKSDRPLIVLIYERTLSISFSLCFTMVSSIFSSERTILVLSDGAQGASNTRYTLFLFTSGCSFQGILSNL